MSVPDRSIVAVLSATLLMMSAAHAASCGTFKGELKFQSIYIAVPHDSLSEALGVGSHWDNGATLRLMGNGPLGAGWSWDAAWVMDGRQGEGVVLARRLYRYNPSAYAPSQRRNLWGLEHSLTDAGNSSADLYIDRLSLAWSGAHAVVKLGRQALTWGGGLVFHPMDLVNPFPPNATDIEYKPGADMLYGQWLFDSGADIQGVIVPRRDPLTGSIESNQSTAGLKWHSSFGALQQYGYQIMIVRDYDADVVGTALNGSLLGATWTAEVVPTRPPHGAWQTSWLINIQYAWFWFTKNFTGYAEYYRNGFGIGGSNHTLADLPASLAERLDRGELFTVSRNYLALGIALEWTPLLNIKPLVMMNLDDNSALVEIQAVRSLGDNVDLTVSAQSGLGPHGTENGGLETAPGSATYIAPDSFLSLRIDWYF